MKKLKELAKRRALGKIFQRLSLSERAQYLAHVRAALYKPKRSHT